ncbi:MAG TPA: DUF192 domain-containing protein [Labilithrix sp.]|nr:DUF192 domain-containing protein [Labilithrix sp.]
MSHSSAFARASAALVLLGLGAACSRTPPEPAPASTINVSPPPAATVEAASPPSAVTLAPTRAPLPAASGRCITPVAAEPPPIPPVASLAVCPKDPDGIPKAQTGQVTFPDAPGAPKVDVELAMTEKEITRGLMYRRTMAEEHGMLFHLEERREHTFWMHNTCMPLDMLFVDEDGTIVGIVESATPLTDTSRTVGCPSLFVLEVNAGWCRRHGVKPGQKLGIPSNAR